MSRKININQKSLKLHKKLKGKFEIRSRVDLSKPENLSTAYTPGVGAVCSAIKKKKNLSWEMTNRGNMVAIVSDGTAILGLGNIGPEAGMPVMEGKAIIFKEFAGIDAIPLCIKADNANQIVKFCKQIEPSFGGICLEDIAAPRCFIVTEKLEKELNIAVFHDDQDGSAIVTLAALINACRVSGRYIKEQKVVVCGAGAAGIATTRLLLHMGIKDIILVDSQGAIHKDRPGLNIYKSKIAKKTNKKMVSGDIETALSGADVFIGVSKGGILNGKMIKKMNKNPIIFALANPTPEIMPKAAIRAGASIVGTGRSDFPNQINNALAFPGLFRGLLDSWSKKLTTKMKLDAAVALAYSIKKPSKNKILPNITDKKVVKNVSQAVISKKVCGRA